jgi:hypothetical protein
VSTTRIRWEPTGNGGFEGYVGTLEPCAFTIWKYSSDVEWWTLTGLIGAMRTSPHGDDPDDLKAEAERLLSEFACSLGAVFAEETKPAPEPPLTCEWCRNAPAVTLIFAEYGDSRRVKSLVCEPCGTRAQSDAAKVAKAAWLFTLESADDPDPAPVAAEGKD